MIRKKNILLCGAGNAVHIISSLTGKAGNKAIPHIYSILPNEIEKLQKSHPLEILTHYHNNDYIGKVEKVVGSPEIVADMDIIFMSMPGFLHSIYLKSMAPYIKPGTTIVGLPGNGNFNLEVHKILGEEKFNQMNIVSTKTLPWVCVTHEFGKTGDIQGVKEFLDTACRPSGSTKEICEILTEMIGFYIFSK